MSIRACNNCGEYNTDVISTTIEHNKEMVLLEVLCGSCNSTTVLVFALAHAEVIKVKKPNIIIPKGVH